MLKFSGSRLKLSVCEPFLDKSIIRYRNKSKAGKVLYDASGFEKNPHFIGRTSVLDTLREMLCDDNPKKHKHRVALFSLGGIGENPDHNRVRGISTT